MSWPASTRSPVSHRTETAAIQKRRPKRNQIAKSRIHTRAPDSWNRGSCCILASPSCHDCRSEIPIVEERLKSCSTVMGDLGGTGNKYDDDRCGISDGTLGNASKMSRSKSFLDDGEMASSEPGASGMMGGSMGDCSGITSSRCSIADQLSCNRSTTTGN